jgi:hypothetical protein
MEDVKDIIIKAIKFWTWFETIATELLQNPTRTDLISQIDDRVQSLGNFDWELGPYKEGMFYFSISPNLSNERLELTRQFAKLAPKCEGWVFLPAKPAKEWQGVWKMKNHVGKEILVDSSNWEYVLYGFEDSTFDIDIKVGELEGDLETHNLAVNIALTGYLGEEEFMTSIANIYIVDEFEDDIKSRATQLQFIKKHIDSL